MVLGSCPGRAVPIWAVARVLDGPTPVGGASVSWLARMVTVTEKVVGSPQGVPLVFRPEFGRGYPLNLSISLSGGKETNKDSLSNGE